ncbi:MAG: hypothetical protein FWD63_02080 [Propionibacteriaceae bacterium]|nr:hypothetical protein [Propionibacteriaceae bacterium]
MEDTRSGPLSGGLRQYTLVEILDYYGAGTHNDELDSAKLFPEDDGPYTLESRFFVLPDWQWTGDAEVAAFADSNSLQVDCCYLGEQLTDVIGLARQQVGSPTRQQLVDAYNYYLEMDDFLDLA